MIPRTRRYCRWTALAASLSAACSVQPAHADPRREAPLEAHATTPAALELVGPRGIDPPVDGEELFLEVIVNQAMTGHLARFVQRHGRLYAEPETLREIGLAVPPDPVVEADGLMPLDGVPGLGVTYDAEIQRLYLMVPVRMLGGAEAQYGYRPPPAPVLDPATRAPGLLLNYDVYAQGDETYSSVSAWHELRLFGAGPGVWRNSGLLRSIQAEGERGDSNSAVRLDTSWQLDFPEPMISITLGDSYAGALDWTRSYRFGGIRASRNFDLQPYRLTVPLATFAGDAALPSTVDLFINGMRRSSQRVAPGQFQLVGVPTLNGAGSAQVVITDINGQTRTIGFSLYNSRQLLQPGLSDWSIEAGWVRRDYGIESFEYADEAMLSGSIRHGISPWLTAEAHAETAGDLEMGGAGVVVRLGDLGGVFDSSWATSRYGDLDGDQRAVGYQWQNPRFSVNLSTLRRDRGFRDVASLEGSRSFLPGYPQVSLLPLRSDLAYAGMRLGRGQVGASYVRQDYAERQRSRFASLSWSYSFAGAGSRRGGAHLSLSYNRDLEQREADSGYLYLSVPFGARHQAWAGVRHRDEGDTVSIGAARSIAGDRDDWGWRAQTDLGTRGGGMAEASRLNRYGLWRGGIQYWDDGGRTSLYANATGGLLFMEGHFFPMRRVYDAFALVSTDGIAGVPIRLENRYIGDTDDNGLLLVTPLNAWQENDLSIDALGLPADVSIDRVHVPAVPATASGMLVRFPMRPVVAVQLALRGADGRWLPAGTNVRIEPAPEDYSVSKVGYDGLLYLESPPAGARLHVAPNGAPGCSATLPAQLPARGWIDLGILECR